MKASNLCRSVLPLIWQSCTRLIRLQERVSSSNVASLETTTTSTRSASSWSKLLITKSMLSIKIQKKEQCVVRCAELKVYASGAVVRKSTRKKRTWGLSINLSKLSRMNYTISVIKILDMASSSSLTRESVRISSIWAANPSWNKSITYSHREVSRDCRSSDGISSRPFSSLKSFGRTLRKIQHSVLQRQSCSGWSSSFSQWWSLHQSCSSSTSKIRNSH